MMTEQDLRTKLKHQDDSAAYQARHKARGLCPRGPHVPAPGRVLCEACLAHMAAYKRARRMSQTVDVIIQAVNDRLDAR